MSAISVRPPFPVFTDLDGKPLDAGYIFVGTANLDPETNPIAVYWDSALTQLAAQPLRTIGGYPARAGTPARVYAGADFSIRVKNKNGITVYSAPTGADLQQASAVSFVGFKGQVGTVQDLGDADGADWVGFTPAGSGAVAMSLQEKARQSVNVLDYMTDADRNFNYIAPGNVDLSYAFQYAIDSVEIGGGDVRFRGLYKAKNINLKAGVRLVGYGAYASVISAADASSVVVTMRDSAEIVGVKIISAVTRSGGYYIEMLGNGCKTRFCEFDGYYIAASVGVYGGIQAVAPLFEHCLFRNPSVSAGCGAIQFLNFSNFMVLDCVGSGAALPGVQADFGIRVRNGDTGFVSGTNFTLHGKSLLIDPPAGQNCYALTVQSSLFDSAGQITGGSSVPCAEINPAGGVYNTKIISTWFGLSQGQSGCYVTTSGSGIVDGLEFVGGDYPDNADCGLIVVGVGVKNWSVTGGQSGGNTNSGIRAAGGTSNFAITSHTAGTASGRGPNAYGITVDAGSASNNYLVNNNNLVGNTSQGLFSGATGINFEATGNLGTVSIPKVSIASASTPAIPDNGNFFEITGTTSFSTLPVGYAGRVITLKFTGVLTVLDGGTNMYLNGNFVTSANDILVLVSDGTSWYEVSRSTN